MKGGYKKPWKKWLDGVGRNMKANTDTIPKHCPSSLGLSYGNINK